MMERVVDPEVGVAPGARGARATGSPARPAPRSGSAPSAAATTAPFTVSFAGFAPADDPRFTIYVVVQNPAQRRRRRLGRRPGVLQDHELRAAPLRRPADRHRSPRGSRSSGERRGRRPRVPRRGDRRPGRSDDLAATRPQRPPRDPAAPTSPTWLGGARTPTSRPAATSATAGHRALAELAADPARRPVRRAAGRPRPRRRLRRGRGRGRRGRGPHRPGRAPSAAAPSACPLLVVEQPARRARPAGRPGVRRPGGRRCG